MVNKLTAAQKREILILRQFGSIATEGYGHLHHLLLRMTAEGLTTQGGPGFRNCFRLSDVGKIIVLKSDLKKN